MHCIYGNAFHSMQRPLLRVKSLFGSLLLRGSTVHVLDGRASCVGCCACGPDPLVTKLIDYFVQNYLY